MVSYVESMELILEWASKFSKLGLIGHIDTPTNRKVVLYFF